MQDRDKVHKHEEESRSTTMNTWWNVRVLGIGAIIWQGTEGSKRLIKGTDDNKSVNSCLRDD